jgi:hypothetical protein
VGLVESATDQQHAQAVVVAVGEPDGHVKNVTVGVVAHLTRHPQS